MIFPPTKYFPTYWENGMNLSAEHFQHLENSIEDAIRDNRATALIGLESFGLLPFSAFDIQNTEGQSPRSVRVTLIACRAILPGGYRVEITQDNIQKLQIPIQAPFVEFVPTSGMRYHIFLVINENKRIPAGIPQTRPIRHPYLSPDYHLEVVTQDRISAVKKLAPNRMKIAEWQNGKIIEGYIPPVLLIKGYPLMHQWFQYLQNQLENITRIGIKVISEYRKREPAKAEFCIPIVNYIKSSKAHYKWILPNRSPIHLIAYFGDLASLIEGLIEYNDRDFVRIHLQNGQIHDLKPSVQKVLQSPNISLENTAIAIVGIQRFISALVATLNSFLKKKGPAPRSGERNISSG